MPVCLLKRLLPFTLALGLGIAFTSGSRAILLQQQSADESHPVGLPRDNANHSFYWEDCRCVVWTTDTKMWAQIHELPTPEFTEEARRNHFSGAIQLQVMLGRDGTVEKADPYGELPYGLTERAVEAARRIKFTPASVFGYEPASVRVLVNYDFETVQDGSAVRHTVKGYIFDHFDEYRHGVWHSRLEY